MVSYQIAPLRIPVFTQPNCTDLSAWTKRLWQCRGIIYNRGNIMQKLSSRKNLISRGIRVSCFTFIHAWVRACAVAAKKGPPWILGKKITCTMGMRALVSIWIILKNETSPFANTCQFVSPLFIRASFHLFILRRHSRSIIILALRGRTACMYAS